jgi:hypothetical protein
LLKHWELALHLVQTLHTSSKFACNYFVISEQQFHHLMLGYSHKDWKHSAFELSATLRMRKQLLLG